jgi:hypothetical protein
MKNHFKPSVLVLLALMLLTACGGGQTDGYTTLFDGTDLSAWTTKSPDWKIEGDVLVLDSKGDYVMINDHYLWTKEKYGDFVLELDFKVAEDPIYGMEKFNGEGRPGNSGVFIRVEDPGNPVQTGIEIQVGAIKPGEEPTMNSVGGIFNLAPVTKNMYTPGEWNHYKITCQGSMITVELNGTKTSSADLDEYVTAQPNPDGSKNKFKRPLKDFARTGYIGLQDHGTPAYYKNIKVKKL